MSLGCVIQKKTAKKDLLVFCLFQLFFWDNLAERHGRVKMLTLLKSVFQFAYFDMRQGYHLKT